MADKTLIEWTDSTWSPITGCSMMSEGCRFCYAARLAATRMKHHWSREGLAELKNGRGVFNGEVRFNDPWLDQPLRWKKPRMIFGCPHADLFHEKVPDEWIDKVFAIMALADQHQFQVLTKRADRMREYFHQLLEERDTTRWAIQASKIMDWSWPETSDWFSSISFPLPNVWIGVSAEDQKHADERIPALLDTPAAIRFLSAEPLLANLNLVNYLVPVCEREVCEYEGCANPRGCPELNGLDWVIVGGESGPGARPMHPQWAQDIRDQCKAAVVPFHFKQWGNWAPHSALTSAPPPNPSRRGTVIRLDGQNHLQGKDADGKVTTTWADIEEELARDDTAHVFEYGKKVAGRLLDGVEHNGMPTNVKSTQREKPFPYVIEVDWEAVRVRIDADFFKDDLLCRRRHLEEQAEVDRLRRGRTNSFHEGGIT